MPTPTRLFRTTAFKLSFAYLCVIVVLSLGLIAYISSTTARLFDRQLETAIDREIAELNAEYETSSLFKVMRTIGRRAMRPDASVYLITDFSGNPLAGNVSELMYDPAVVSENVAFPVRYMRFRPGEGGGDEETAHRALVKLSVLGGGYRLLVGRDVEDRIEFATIIRRSIRGAIIIVVALGLLSWIFLSRSVLRKVDGVAASSQKIIAGDLTRRLPDGWLGRRVRPARPQRQRDAGRDQPATRRASGGLAEHRARPEDAADAAAQPARRGDAQPACRRPCA